MASKDKFTGNPRKPRAWEKGDTLILDRGSLGTVEVTFVCFHTVNHVPGRYHTAALVNYPGRGEASCRVGDLTKKETA